MMEWHVLPKERRQSFAAIVLCVLLMCGGSLWAQQGADASGATRHAVFSLQQITPEQGRDFLARLNIGTVSKMPGVDSLLVTGDEVELQKASAVLGLVDSRTEFDVRVLGPALPVMPTNAQIAAAVGGVSIGTFANPPKDKTKMRAIVDVHNGNVVVVASTMQLQDIRYAVELGPNVLRERSGMANPASVPSVSITQATAMLEASLDGQVGDVNGVVASKAAAGQSRQLMLPNEMQEMRRRAAELRAQRQAAMKTSTAPAASSAMSEGSPVAPAAPIPQSDVNNVETPVSTGLQHAGAVPDQNAPAESLPEAVAAKPAAGDTGLQPGQTVPVDSDRITAPKIEPKSITDMNPAPVVAQTTTLPLTPSSPYEPASIPDGDTLINLGLPDRLPVIDLLDLVGKHLNLSYLYDPQKVTGEVTLKLNGTLKGQVRKKDLYPLLEAALQDKDLVMTRHKGNIIRVMPKADAQRLDPELMVEGCDPVQAGNAIVQKVFSLKHIECASADNLLQGMGLAVGVVPMAESRKMIVTAYAHRMGRIEQLLDLVDQPGAPRKFRYRQLRYTMAKTLAEKVKALAEQLENVSVTIGSPDTTPENPVKMPGESDVAYRTRLATIRQQQASLRAQQLAARGQAPQEPKPGVYLDADERTNRILMIGQDEQLTTVEELVDALDIVQQELRALRLYRMKHVDAEEVARKLQELGVIHRMPETTASQRTSQRDGRITGQPTVAAARTPGQPAVGDTSITPAGTELTEEGLVSEPQVVVVESNNSLLVNGTPEQHAKIASIIEYVDSEMDLEEIPYKIYPLENSSPAHLSEILTSLIEESTEQTQNKEGKIEKVVTKRQEEIAIVPDPNTYSLIVYASKKNQEWIQTLIKQLDKRRPQVLIDVTLVEVTKSESFDYDLQLVESWPNLGDAAALGSATGNAIKALTTPSDLNAAGRDHIIGVGSKNGQGTAYFADKHVNALLTAMQSKNYGRVLAKPKILVNDNEPGDIKTADITYVKKTSSVPFQSATAGQTSTSVQTSIDYEPYDAGIELNITPHISEGDLLRLDIMLKRSDFRPTDTVDAPPNTTTSEVQTAVTVPDGSTIILGGMVKLNQNKGGSKVPILGDLPLLGGLFRSVSNSDNQSKLYVFVKAEVIRPEGELAQGMKDLTEISDRNRMAFEKHEMEFQKYQDWPGVKPKPVDPAKVLDAQ
ncbi:MAG: secretin N-terminal domain-containing protein [Phycisphaerales bacterium]